MIRKVVCYIRHFTFEIFCFAPQTTRNTDSSNGLLLLLVTGSSPRPSVFPPRVNLFLIYFEKPCRSKYPSYQTSNE